MKDLEYAGFWVRVGAALIDTLLMIIIIFPILSLVYGQDYWLSESFFVGFWNLVLNYILPAIAVILFWTYKSATPGKMVFRLKIVDANTGGKVSPGRLIGRYLGYYVSTIPFFLGLIWVGIDKSRAGTISLQEPWWFEIRKKNPCNLTQKLNNHGLSRT